MKKFILLVALCPWFKAASQNLPEAIHKTENERYEVALADLKILISKEPTKGDNYFYCGELYFKKNMFDSARYYYNKGAELNPTYPLNYVGQGKVFYFEDKIAEANAAIFKATAISKNKMGEVLRKQAEIYIIAKTKRLDDAIKLINMAIKLEPTQFENYLLLGDAILEQNPAEGSVPITHYNKAAELNPKSPKSIIRIGKLYERAQNYDLGLEYYAKAIALDPTYAPAYREQAELFFKKRKKQEAIASYKKYLELNESPTARERYASFLYADKNYAEAVLEITNLQAKGKISLYLERCLAGSLSELTEKKVDTAIVKRGLQASTNFFEITKSIPKFKYVINDYKYRGTLNLKIGNDSLAMLDLKTIEALDSTSFYELNKDYAKIFLKAKKYPKVIAIFNFLNTKAPKYITNLDWYDFGRNFYYEGGAKLREKKDTLANQDFVKADSCFSKLTKMQPSYAMGYFWRGKVNVQLDPKDLGLLTKEYFEKALTLVKPEQIANYKPQIIEANLFLGSHYSLSKDKDETKAKAAFDKIKEIDPENKVMVDFFKKTTEPAKPAETKAPKDTKKNTTQKK